MIDEYVICYNSSPEDLAKEVQTFLVEGYQPYGLLFVHNNDLYQVMVRDEIDSGEDIGRGF